MTDSPRVFISYAHSDEHSPVVLELADRLRTDGVEAWIDQYEQAPPAGWRAWMEEQLREADFILVVASQLYRRRAESTGPLERGLGARYESMLILDALYESAMWNVRFVPVVLLEQDTAHIPAPLRSFQRYSLYHAGGYTRLLRHLTGQPEVVAPPVGELRRLPSRERSGGSGRSSTRGPAPADGSESADEVSRGGLLGGFLGRSFSGPSDGPGDGWKGLTADDTEDADVETLPPEDHPNPFDPWTPAVPPRFQGRGSELRRLEKALETGFGVSVVGDGRIGKSSLLRTFQGVLAAAARTVRYLDGNGPEGESIAAFVARIVRQPVSQVPDDADRAANTLSSWIDGHNGEAPILLVDEFDGLPARFDPRFFERLRNLIGRLVLVVASRKEVDRIYDEMGKTSPFDNRLKLIRVGLFRNTAADGVLDLAGGLLSTDDTSELRRWAGRHAHYLQLYAYHLLEARAHGEEEEALDRFIEEASSRLRDLWRHLNEKEQAHLRALAGGEDPRAPRTLIRRGVLEKDGRPFGEVLETWMQEEL